LTIRRFSSRTTPLDQGFLADQLQGARSYRRIAGDFTGSLFEVAHGDTLVVWKLDRLARPLKQLAETVETLEERGVGFRSLTEAIEAIARETGREDLAIVRDLPQTEGQDWNDVLRAVAAVSAAPCRAEGSLTP
jgi:hypothetical protein